MSKRAKAIKELNARHAMLAGAGKVRIMRFHEDGTFTLESVFDFRNWYANRTIAEVKINDKGDTKRVETPVADVWLTSPDRRQYDQIVFDPRATPRGAFNMWRGFSVEPNSIGSCARFLDHLRANVCGGNEELYTYIIAWLAHLVQRPWEKPGVAVVFKGEKGVGKSIVGEIVGALVESHFVTVDQPRHFVGNFNAHLARAVVVLVEEAFWAGDKVGEGALKQQITGPTIRVERKGFDVEQLPSFHRYIITGNAHWVVPASHDDRRYAVFNVGNAHQGDRDYFRRMLTEMRAGGYEALLHHLLTFDLSRVDVGVAPKSEGLRDQKIAGLRNVQAWWHDLLTEGAFPDWTEIKGDWESGPLRIRCSEMRKLYESFVARRRHHGDLISAEEFGRELHAMCRGIERKQKRVSGERDWFYIVPSLEMAHVQFEEWLSGKQRSVTSA